MILSEKIIYILIIVSVVQSSRLLPLLVQNKVGGFLKDPKMSEKINRFIFIGLILYTYRDFSLSYEYLLRVAIGALVFFLQYKFNKLLLSVFLGTFLYMVLRNYPIV